MIFNYKKCTLSFFECKFRGVKKENGYLYRFMDKFINLRYEPLFFTVILVYTLCVSYYYFSNGGKLRF